MTRMPELESARLRIRELAREDLGAAHAIMLAGFPSEPAVTLQARRAWLDWTIASYEQLALLMQPPYGERAIVHKETGAVIGLIGFAPGLMPFGILPSLADPAAAPERGYTSEVAMFWAVAPAERRQGFAAEAARMMIDYAFGQMHLKRIVATTEHDNAGSQGVMRAAGMRLERNPGDKPPWMQVVGMRANR